MAELHSDYAKYKCWVFDCDGVLLNSNAVKTQAFYDIAVQYGPDAAKDLVAYHVKFGGISRFVKFEYLFSTILNRAPEPGELDNVLQQFSTATLARLLDCEEAPRLREVLKATSRHGKNFVVSGGFQNEVRDMLEQKGLAHFFTDIFGSPDNKAEIFNRERTNGAMIDPAVFVGDAKYDHEMAEKFGLDFIFVHDWTDFANWPEYLKNKNAKIIASIRELLAIP